MRARTNHARSLHGRATAPRRTMTRSLHGRAASPDALRASRRAGYNGGTLRALHRRLMEHPHPGSELFGAQLAVLVAVQPVEPSLGIAPSRWCRRAATPRRTVRLGTACRGWLRTARRCGTSGALRSACRSALGVRTRGVRSATWCASGVRTASVRSATWCASGVSQDGQRQRPASGRPLGARAESGRPLGLLTASGRPASGRPLGLRSASGRPASGLPRSPIGGPPSGPNPLPVAGPPALCPIGGIAARNSSNVTTPSPSLSALFSSSLTKSGAPSGTSSNATRPSRFLSIR
jgi:hypothetical protein